MRTGAKTAFSVQSSIIIDLVLLNKRKSRTFSGDPTSRM